MIPNACFKTDRPIQCHHPATLAGRGGEDDDEHSRRQSSVQVREFPESPARVLKQNQQDRHVLSLCLHVSSSLLGCFTNPTAGYRCWHGSLLHIVCSWLSLVVGPDDNAGKSKKGITEGKRREPGRRSKGFQVCIELQSRSEATWNQRFTHNYFNTGHRRHSHTQRGMWWSRLECMFYVECQGGVPRGRSVFFKVFLTVIKFGGVGAHAACYISFYIHHSISPRAIAIRLKLSSLLAHS